MDVSTIITVILFVTSLLAITYNVVMMCKENKNKNVVYGVGDTGVYDTWCIDHGCNDVDAFDAMCMNGI